MIILDTNVVSELSRTQVSSAVLGWFDRQDSSSFYFTAISFAEVLSGLALMPDGKRKTLLSADMHELMNKLFDRRILPFDSAAAEAYAQIMKLSMSKGRLLPQSDAFISAIALAKGFAVATRDEKPFRAAGVDVINPWKA